jgi:hypothetical protein
MVTWLGGILSYGRYGGSLFNPEIRESPEKDWKKFSGNDETLNLELV